MIRVYIANCTPLLQDANFQKGLASVSEARREKVNKIVPPQERARSLAVGMLFTYALDALGIAKEDRALSYGERGKPYLSRLPQLQFSMSHSGAYAAVALSDDGKELGIDIEQIGSVEKAKRVSKKVLTEIEGQQMASLEDTNWTHMFYRIWSMKESFVKAVGLGIAIPMSEVDITFGANTSFCACRQGSLISQQVKPSKYYMYENMDITGYALSVCLQAAAADVRYEVIGLDL